jgi:hypothetical protein
MFRRNELLEKEHEELLFGMSEVCIYTNRSLQKCKSQVHITVLFVHSRVAYSSWARGDWGWLRQSNAV